MNPKYILVASAAALFQISVTTAGAAPIYWDGIATGGWDVVANWSSVIGATTPDPAAVPGSADVATFNINGQNTVAVTASLNADQSVSGLSISTTGAVALQGGGTDRILSLGTSGITTSGSATKLTIGSATSGQGVSIALQGSQSWAFNGTNVSGNGLFINNGVSLGVSGSHTLTLAGGGNSSTNVINTVLGGISDGSGTLSLTLNGTANTRWNFTGSNSYSGLTTVTTGALGIQTTNGLGGTTTGTSVASGAALFLRNTGTVSYAAEPLTIAGTGPAGSTRGALRQTANGISTWNGAITADTTAGNVRIGADAGTLTLSNTATIGSIGTGIIEFETTGIITVNGSISGSVGVSKVVGGSGGSANQALTLANNHTYTGPTRVSIGVLSVTGTLANTSSVLVDSGSAIRGTGAINTSALTTINGTIGAGASQSSTGTLSLGALTIGATGALSVDFNSNSLAIDRLNVAGNLTIDSGAALSLNDLGTPATLAIGTAFTLIDYTGTWNGGLFSYGGNPIDDDVEYFIYGNNAFTIDYDGGASGNDVRLLVVVPEPASAAFLLGGFGLLAMRSRRRR